MKQGFIVMLIVVLGSQGIFAWSEPKDGGKLHYCLRFEYTSDAAMEALASVRVPDGSFSWFLSFPPEGSFEAYWTLTLPIIIAGGLSVNELSGLIYNPGGMSVLSGGRGLPAFSAECLSSTRGLVIGKDAGLFVLFDQEEGAGIEPWSAGVWIEKHIGNTALLRSISMYGEHESCLPDTWLMANRVASFWTALQLSAANGGFKAFVQESLRRGSDNSFGWLVQACTGYSDTRFTLFVSLALSNSLYYTPRLLYEPLSDFSAKIRVSPTDTLAIEAWTESTQKEIGKSPILQNRITLEHKGIDGAASLEAEEGRERERIFYIVRGTLSWDCIAGRTFSEAPTPRVLGLSALIIKLTAYYRFNDTDYEEFRLDAVLGIYGAFTCLLHASPIWERDVCELCFKQEFSVEIAGALLKGSITETVRTDGAPPEIIQYGLALSIKQ